MKERELAERPAPAQQFLEIRPAAVLFLDLLQHAVTPERALLKTHTLIGDRIVGELGQSLGRSPAFLEIAPAFLEIARAVVRHHHERYDGRGYPDRLRGEGIPAAARLVALADVYDALRRKRPHKPALAHQEAARIILEESVGQFDPALQRVFSACQGLFEGINEELIG